MHSVILRRLAADHIEELVSRAADARRRVKRAASAGVRRRRPDGLFPVLRAATKVATGACDEHNEKAHPRLS